MDRLRLHRGPAALALVLAAACDDGSDGAAGTPGTFTPTATTVAATEDAPTVSAVVLSLGGASGAGGNFAVGDRLTVRFELRKADGSRWRLSEMTAGAALVSGPTFNYQRVIALVSTVLADAVDHGDGTYGFTFPPLPATYLAPYNDSPSFGTDDGELTGQALLDGTYTAGLSFTWEYTVEGQGFTRVGEATVDFALGGGAGPLLPRDVTREENCNRCHGRLEAHGGRYRSLAMCFLCHTAGAEDRNDPMLAGGTPGVSIESRVLFHRIHNAKRLPSVLGIGVDAFGARDFSLAPAPFVVAGAGGVVDYSESGFPAFPNRTQPMPRGGGYDSFPTASRAKDEEYRRGLTDCSLCHGDPDGAGPLVAPTQGANHLSAFSRKTCGSCHDDLPWTSFYFGGSAIMPPQSDDTQCFGCHGVGVGGVQDVELAHRHPLLDPAFDPGVNVELSSVAESGTNDGDGTLDVGERIAITIRVTDDSGMDVAPNDLRTLRAAVNGPTTNAQALLDVAIPTALLTGAPPYTFELPATRYLEPVGVSTGALETFTLPRVPVQDPGASTLVGVRIALGGGASTLATAAPAGQNFLDVTDASSFARNDFVVVADGTGAEEYLRVQGVEGDRLWLSSSATPIYPPSTRFAHASGVSVLQVLFLPKVQGTDYSLDPVTGVLTEMVEFGAGNAVIATWLAPFEVPATYPVPLNGSPDLGAPDGEWAGEALVDGTYRVGVWASREFTTLVDGVTTTYRTASPAAVQEVLVGSAAVVEPYDLLSSAASCDECHVELGYHDGRDRGVETCLLCHGSAGAEDRPTWVAPNAPPTTGASISFREMVHRVHNARRLADPDAFRLVGAGTDPHPDNFTVNEPGSVLFPVWPGEAANCAKCHGQGNASTTPRSADHPTSPIEPTRAWARSCGACHDDAPALAHMDLRTTVGGVESCAICHGPGELLSVENAHRAR